MRRMARSALLPHVMAVNVDALRARQPGSEALGRYDEVARLLTGHDHARADDSVRWMGALTRALNVPGLSTYGLTEAAFDDLVDKSSRANSMKGNPIPLTPGEMRDILTRAL
jgi:alcohol dehydrogenase class IV